MKHQTVSIIIPVYNAQTTLCGCINSVVEQTYPSLEILLVDDGSSDSSLIIAKQFMASDTRIRILHHSNKGVSYTRNRGLDYASGDFIMFVDADDTIAPEWVEKYVTAITEANADIAIGGLTEIKNDGSTRVHYPPVKGVIREEIWKYLCETGDGIFGYVPNKIYKREVIDDYRFDERMTVQEDLSFAVDVYSKAASIVLIDEAGYYYKHETGKRMTPFLDLIGNQLKIYSYASAYINQYNITFENVVRLIIVWSFQYLYESKLDDNYVKTCEAVRAIQSNYDFKFVKKKMDEKRIIYELLMRKRYRAIKYWFIVRKNLKRALLYLKSIIKEKRGKRGD